MIISNSRKFIFVHIHKTAGSSVAAGIVPHLAWNDLYLGGSNIVNETDMRYETQYGLHKHSKIDDIVSCCGAELVQQYFSFSIVREPVARALSLYNYIADLISELGPFLKLSNDEMAQLTFGAQTSALHPAFSWNVTRAYFVAQNFSDFIRLPDTLSDMGFRPQIDSLISRDLRVQVDMIIKLEDLPGKLPELWEKLGFRFFPEHKNRPKNYALNIDEVNKRDRAYLHELFSVDYVGLEYK